MLELKFYLHFIWVSCSRHIYGVYIYCSSNWHKKGELLLGNSNSRTSFKHVNISEAMISYTHVICSVI